MRGFLHFDSFQHLATVEHNEYKKIMKYAIASRKIYIIYQYLF